MIERVIRTLKEPCVLPHRFESQVHALRVIADRIAFYNQQRPHQALKMMTPYEACADTLTAWPEHKTVDHYRLLILFQEMNALAGILGT